MSWHQEELEKILASPDMTLEAVLPRMNDAAMQVILVVDDSRRLQGIITDGDIRRGLLRRTALDLPLGEIMQTSPKYLSLDCSLEEARVIMLTKNIRHIPLLDGKRKVKDIILWTDLFSSRLHSRREKVVIMAGGKGTRLDPFTKILPKPMIPLGDKPMIEVIMDKFYERGFSNFTLSLGYKGEIVKLYFQENNGREYDVNFIKETQALGTAGSLSLLKGTISETFLVTNCDIIVEAEYEHLLEYHREKGNVLTVVGALRNFVIPYGVLRTEEQELQTIDEKPSFHFLVNTGLYILEPEVLALVEEGQFLDMTELLIRAKNNNMQVGVYPHHGKWFDVGQWEEYRQTLRQFGYSG